MPNDVERRSMFSPWSSESSATPLISDELAACVIIIHNAICYLSFNYFMIILDQVRGNNIIYLVGAEKKLLALVFVVIVFTPCL